MGGMLLGWGLHAQSALASAQLKNMHGKMVSYASITQKDSLVLICFWATTSDASIDELNAINASYENWTASVRFRLMIVAVDEGKAANKIRPMLNANGWTFDVYADINGDLRRALNSNNLPQSMIIRNGKVIYQQSGYEPGSENYLFTKIQAIAAGKQ
ncbi:MAG TPA: redoxin domain-containing protein [Puia sp.]|nr:redoxin domain-containing protein [Puia sp.]